MSEVNIYVYSTLVTQIKLFLGRSNTTVPAINVKVLKGYFSNLQSVLEHHLFKNLSKLLNRLSLSKHLL